MNLHPLLTASPAIQLHAFAAMSAFALGLVQLAAPKGTLPHRTIGWIWVGLMLAVAISSFFIHELKIWGPWSPIHLLSIFTLATLPIAVWRAHHHQVRRHRNAMISLFLRGAGGRGAVHVHARTHHPSGCFRALKRAIWRPIGAFSGQRFRVVEC